MSLPLSKALLCWVAQLESPEQEQFDSAQEDVEEEEGGVTSALDTEIDASTDEEMEASGRPGSGALCGEVPLKESCHAKGADLGASRISRA